MDDDIAMHGDLENGNEAFVAFYNPKLNKNKLPKGEWIDNKSEANVIAQYIKNVNIPLLSEGEIVPRFQNDKRSKLAAWRSEELRLRYLLEDKT